MRYYKPNNNLLLALESQEPSFHLVGQTASGNFEPSSLVSTFIYPVSAR